MSGPIRQLLSTSNLPSWTITLKPDIVLRWFQEPCLCKKKTKSHKSNQKFVNDLGWAWGGYLESVGGQLIVQISTKAWVIFIIPFKGRIPLPLCFTSRWFSCFPIVPSWWLQVKRFLRTELWRIQNVPSTAAVLDCGLLWCVNGWLSDIGHVLIFQNRLPCVPSLNTSNQGLATSWSAIHLRWSTEMLWSCGSCGEGAKNLLTSMQSGWNLSKIHIKIQAYIWVFPKIVVPRNGWFIRENLIKMDNLLVPLFLETPICGMFLSFKRTCLCLKHPECRSGSFSPPKTNLEPETTSLCQEKQLNRLQPVQIKILTSSFLGEWGV